MEKKRSGLSPAREKFSALMLGYTSVVIMVTIKQVQIGR
jgi:hypothetical protein